MAPDIAILQPVVALVIWTMLIWIWMYSTRIPAINAAGIEPDSLANDPAAKLDNILPPRVQWKSHNFTNLHESPTVFYAIAITLSLIGHGDGWALRLAWAYVVLRVIHSLVQVTFNKVIVRFAVYMASSLALLGLIVIAALAVFRT